jgi:cation transport ATPase
MTLAQIDLHSPKQSVGCSSLDNTGRDTDSIDTLEGAFADAESASSGGRVSLSHHLRNPVFPIRYRLAALTLGVTAVLVAHLFEIYHPELPVTNPLFAVFLRYSLEALASLLFFICGGAVFAHAQRMVKRGLWETPFSFLSCAALLLALRSLVLVIGEPATFNLLTIPESTLFLLCALFLLAFLEEFRLIVLIRLQSTDDEILPETCKALEGGERHSLPRSECSPGTVLVVGAGDVIPATGIVRQGEAVIGRQSSLFSGRHICAKRGHLVCIGYVVYSGEIEVLVTDHDDYSPQSYLESVLHESRGEVSQATSPLLRYARLFAFLLAVGIVISLARIFQSQFNQPVSVLLGETVNLSLLIVVQSIVLTLPLIHRAALVAFFRLGVLVADSSALKRLAQIRHVVFDLPVPPDEGVMRLKSFEILDDRFERPAVMSLLRVLLARSTYPFFARAALTFIEADSSHRAPEVLSFESLGDSGFVAQVEGAEVIVGDEELLLEIGIPLQPTDSIQTDSDDEQVYLVAVSKDIVARLVFEGRQFLNGGDLADRFVKSRLFPHLFSVAPVEQIDQCAHRLGFELAQVKGGLTSVEYLQKLQDIPRCAFVAHGTHKGHQLADVSISLFDRLQWNAHQTDVVLLSRHVRLVPALFRWSCCLVTFEYGGLGVAGLLTLLLMVGIWSGVLTIAATLGILLGASLTFSLALGVLFYRLRPERNPFSLVFEATADSQRDEASVPPSMIVTR